MEVGFGNVMGEEASKGVPEADSSRGGRLDPGEQPRDAVLAEEGLRAVGEGPAVRFRVVVSGEDRDLRGAPCATQGDQSLQAVQPRHAKVQKDPGRTPIRPGSQRATTVGAVQTVMTSKGEGVPQPISKSFVIVDNHDPHRPRSVCAARVPTNMASPTQPRGRVPLST